VFRSSFQFNRSETLHSLSSIFMLAPLRRSIRERLLESATRGRVSIRQIHVQNATRGAAAAQEQSNEIISVFKQYESRDINEYAREASATQKQKQQQQQPQPQPQKQTQNQKQMKAQKKPSSREAKKQTATQKRTNKKQSETIKSYDVRLNVLDISQPETGPSRSPLETAANLDSRQIWDENAIKSLYSSQTPDNLPIIQRKAEGHIQSFRWQENPLEYIGKGLGLQVDLNYVKIKSGSDDIQVRVRLVARWSQDVVVAIGDGRNKVQISSLINTGIGRKKRSSSSPLQSA
jgi:outer membrane biosynthesis protein TonB